MHKHEEYIWLNIFVKSAKKNILQKIYKEEIVTAHIVEKGLKCTVNYFGARPVTFPYMIVFVQNVVRMATFLPLMQGQCFLSKGYF